MLVNCVAYQDGRKLADIGRQDISKYVTRRDCFVWVALYEPDPAELAAMQQEFELHELAIEDARHGHELPKLEEYGDELFVVLHTVQWVDGELHSWGPCNPEHTYSTSFVVDKSGPLRLAVMDLDFRDNVGNLQVTLTRG